MYDIKRIIIGISGGIAAYKIPQLIRLFKKQNIEVKVVATSSALKFVTPITLETLSGNPVYYEMFSNINEYTTEHISITDWADCMIVAPATANIIGKFTSGIADDALSTIYLSFNKKVFIAPSMNTKMYEHNSVQRNLYTLKNDNVEIIEPATGFLACGYEGKGRMESPENIFSYVINYYSNNKLLKGKKVLVTAGPTYEPIDSVRYIGNYSSGKMGYFIAESFEKLGAQVTLVSGPSSLKLNSSKINLIKIQTAQEMFERCKKLFSKSDITVMAAAVADFTPKLPKTSKIKKQEKINPDIIGIELKKTTDILNELGKLKKENQILSGFALETDNEIENAKSKLHNKNLNFIVLNSPNDKGSGFNTDTNKITIIDKENTYPFELKHKKEVADDIVEYILKKHMKSSKIAHETHEIQ